eukprot:g7968.t1
MKNALHILDEARRPVELSESRQGKLGLLSNSLKMIRPQMITLTEHQRNFIEAGSIIAEATDLHKLYRACERACKIAVTCTHSAFLMVDPLDSGRLVSESISKVMTIAPESSVVGHAAATKETVNMAVADMSDWPTRDPRDDNGMDPNQFHQSFSRDPTKSVLCVPVLSDSKSVLGVLYVENENKRAHFKRRGQRRQSSRGSIRKKKGIDERALAPPFSQEDEDSIVILAKYVKCALVHIMNGDVSNAFAKHAARFRDMRTKHKCLKSFEKAVQKRRQKVYDQMRGDLAQATADLAQKTKRMEEMTNRYNDMQIELQIAKETEEVALKERKQLSNTVKLLEAQLKAAELSNEKLVSHTKLLTSTTSELKARLKKKQIQDDADLLKLEERLEHYQLLLKTAEKEAKHEKAEKIIKNLMFQSQSQAFRAWASFAAQSKAQKLQAKRLLARVLNHVLAYNFDKFVKIWQDGKEQRRLKKRALAHLKNRELSSGYRNWLNYCKRRDFVRRFLNKMVRQWENKEISSAFNSFKVWYRFQIAEDERLRREELQKANKRSSFCEIL